MTQEELYKAEADFPSCATCTVKQWPPCCKVDNGEVACCGMCDEYDECCTAQPCWRKEGK